MKRSALGSLSLCAMLLAGRCLAAAPGKQDPPAAQPAPEYRLHLSDSLEITFAFSPEYNQTSAVLPDGNLALKEAGQVEALGATLPELERRVAQAYSGVLRDPRVSVTLRDYQKPSYYASGEVGKPGRYDLRANTTLLEALSEAGGLVNERAKKSQVIVFRPQGNGAYKTWVIDVKTILAPKENLVEVYTVRAGDIVYVPQNRFSKVSRYIPSANIGTYVSPTSY